MMRSERLINKLKELRAMQVKLSMIMYPIPRQSECKSKNYNNRKENYRMFYQTKKNKLISLLLN